MRTSGPGVRLCGRFGGGLLRHVAGSGPGGPPERQGRATGWRQQHAHGHRRRFRPPRNLRRVAFGRALPRGGRPPGTPGPAGAQTPPHPQSDGRFARSGVGHNDRGGHHALQPGYRRLQTFRAGTLYGLLQPRHADPHCRGRGTPLGEDEQIRFRLLRPQEGLHRTVLQRPPAPRLPDDQRRGPLRRAGRCAVALDLLRARPAQSRAAGAARRGLHARFAGRHLLFGRNPCAAQRQPGTGVGRHARRRTDCLWRERAAALPAAAQESRHDLRPARRPCGPYLGGNQGRGALQADPARRGVRRDPLCSLRNRPLFAQRRPGLLGRGRRPRPHLGGDLRRRHQRAGRPAGRPFHPCGQSADALSAGRGGARAVAAVRPPGPHVRRDGRRTADFRPGSGLQADAFPAGAEDSGRRVVAGQQRHHPHAQGFAGAYLAGDLRRRAQLHRALRCRRDAALPVLRPVGRTAEQYLHGHRRGQAGRPVGVDPQRRVALSCRAGRFRRLQSLRPDAQRHSERSHGADLARRQRAVRRRTPYLPFRAGPHPFGPGRLQSALYVARRAEQAGDCRAPFAARRRGTRSAGNRSSA